MYKIIKLFNYFKIEKIILYLLTIYCFTNLPSTTELILCNIIMNIIVNKLLKQLKI